MQKYISFYAAWFGLWATIIALELSLFQIAIAPDSKGIALRLAKSSTQQAFLANLFFFTSRLSVIFFGQRLVSKRAFWRGLILSAFVFTIAYSVAIATTPISRDMEHGVATHIGDIISFLSWGRYLPSSTPDFLSWLLSVFLAVRWLSIEFVYVVKSRYLLKFIREDSKLYFGVFLVVSDVASTIVIFSICAPVVITIIGKLLLVASGDNLNADITTITTNSPIAQAIILDPEFGIWRIYKTLCGSIFSGIWSHLRGDFSSFFLWDLEPPPTLSANCFIWSQGIALLTVSQ